MALRVHSPFVGPTRSIFRELRSSIRIQHACSSRVEHMAEMLERSVIRSERRKAGGSTAPHKKTKANESRQERFHILHSIIE